MVTELQKLQDRLCNRVNGEILRNFKVTLGYSPSKLQEELCAAINDALDQMESMNPTKSIDGHLTTTHINDFIGQ